MSKSSCGYRGISLFPLLNAYSSDFIHGACQLRPSSRPHYRLTLIGVGQVSGAAVGSAGSSVGDPATRPPPPAAPGTTISYNFGLTILCRSVMPVGRRHLLRNSISILCRCGRPSSPDPRRSTAERNLSPLSDSSNGCLEGLSGAVTII